MNCIRIVSPCPRPRPRPCPLLTGGKVGVHVQPHFVPAAGHLQQVLLALVVVHKRHAAVAKHGRRAAPRRRVLGRRRSRGCPPRSAPSLLGLRQLARRGQHAEKHAARARGDATRAGRRAAWAFSGQGPGWMLLMPVLLGRQLPRGRLRALWALTWARSARAWAAPSLPLCS